MLGGVDSIIWCFFEFNEYVSGIFDVTILLVVVDRSRVLETNFSLVVVISVVVCKIVELIFEEIVEVKSVFTTVEVTVEDIKEVVGIILSSKESLIVLIWTVEEMLYFISLINAILAAKVEAKIWFSHWEPKIIRLN